LGVVGVGSTTSTAASASWSKLTQAFTATAASHDVTVDVAGSVTGKENDVSVNILGIDFSLREGLARLTEVATLSVDGKELWFVSRGPILMFLGAAMVLALTACDRNMSQGPLSLKREGEDLVVAVCEDVEAKSVLVETWASGNGTPTSTVLDASGEATLLSGSAFSTRASVAGLVVVDQNAPAMNPGDNFAVQILSTKAGARDINATFTVGDDGLSEDLWLHPDGRETVDACR